MDTVYCGYFPTYEAYLCALVHIGIDFKSYDIYSHFKLCSRYSNQFGNLIFVGLDNELNKVYAMGCKGFGDVVINSQSSFHKICNIRENIKYIDTVKISTSLPHVIEKIKDYDCLYNTARRLFYYWCQKTYSKAKYFVEDERLFISK